jgi:hypothetical protein
MNVDKLFEPEYIQKLKDDPKEALLEMGVEPTQEMIDALDVLDIDALMQLMQALNQTWEGPSFP